MTTIEPFTIERTFDISIDKVWKAITDKDQMKHWYFDLQEFRADVGFKFSFEGGPPGKVYIHRCEVTEVIPNKKLTYSWRYEGYSGVSFVIWELESLPDGKTRLKLSHEGLESFPSDNPDLAAHNFEKGWTEIIGSSLNDYLEKLKS